MLIMKFNFSFGKRAHSIFRVTALSFVLSSVQLIYAQEVTEFPMQKSSLLWKIEGPSLKKGSYLFGTMHLIEKEYFIFPENLKKITSKCDVLVMEIAGLPSQPEALRYLQLQQGAILDPFSKEQRDSILLWAKTTLNMNEESFNAALGKMKPFVLVQMATQLNFMGKTESYEKTLEMIAKENGLQVKGLETLAEQMALFDNLKKEDEVELVMEAIRDKKKSIQRAVEMEKIYVSQNVDSMYLAVVSAEGSVISDEQLKFLDERNEKWIPQIIEMLKNQKCFIAVGAAHLGGPNGVIRLLEEKGYKITPVQI
jgi:uncharacterized protein YbaP (TraB family)